MTLSTLSDQARTAGAQLRAGPPPRVPTALPPSHHRYVRNRIEQDPLQRLTHRQREVLELIAEGLSNAAIARLLSITERAVVRHISNIYDHLDLPLSDDDHRRVRAVLCYITR
jgi:DNA-binding NarL/FixJ family response regulator